MTRTPALSPPPTLQLVLLRQVLGEVLDALPAPGRRVLSPRPRALVAPRSSAAIAAVADGIVYRSRRHCLSDGRHTTITAPPRAQSTASTSRKQSYTSATLWPQPRVPHRRFAASIRRTNRWNPRPDHGDALGGGMPADGRQLSSCSTPKSTIAMAAGTRPQRRATQRGHLGGDARSSEYVHGPPTC